MDVSTSDANEHLVTHFEPVLQHAPRFGILPFSALITVSVIASDKETGGMSSRIADMEIVRIH